MSDIFAKALQKMKLSAEKRLSDVAVIKDDIIYPKPTMPQDTLIEMMNRHQRQLVVLREEYERRDQLGLIRHTEVHE